MDLAARQEHEYLREQAVEQAVSAADKIILDASDGSIEETDYMTAEVAKKFVEKLEIAAMNKLNKKELTEEINAPRKSRL